MSEEGFEAPEWEVQKRGVWRKTKKFTYHPKDDTEAYFPLCEFYFSKLSNKGTSPCFPTFERLWSKYST